MITFISCVFWSFINISVIVVNSKVILVLEIVYGTYNKRSNVNTTWVLQVSLFRNVKSGL